MELHAHCPIARRGCEAERKFASAESALTLPTSLTCINFGSAAILYRYPWDRSMEATMTATIPLLRRDHVNFGLLLNVLERQIEGATETGIQSAEIVKLILVYFRDYPPERGSDLWRAYSTYAKWRLEPVSCHPRPP
jgi:hypothetical protein